MTHDTHGASGLKESRRQPGMVRMGRGKTDTPAVLNLHAYGQVLWNRNATGRKLYFEVIVM